MVNNKYLKNILFLVDKIVHKYMVFIFEFLHLQKN